MTAANPRLQFTLRSLGSRKRMTTCDFAIFIDDVAVWPARGEDDVWLPIQIDDLLGYLTDFWKPLMLRQVYPIDVSPTRPSDLRRAAEERWAEPPPASVEAEEEAVSNFEEAHDLALCFAGMFGLPSFWILRSGDEVILETARTLWKPPFEAVHRALSGLGDEICERLAAADQDRWGEAIKAWRCRDDADGTGLLAWSVGVHRSLAKFDRGRRA
jgi:hypothetical protein